MKKFPLLEAKDIEVKIKQVTGKGAVALLYKTARVDMEMLDKTVSPEAWENDYKQIDGVLFCGIGIRENDRVIWKWSNGTESRSDGEGNEKKGEASDAFKRAGFMWGIGRELYTAPFIFLNVATVGDDKSANSKPKYRLEDKYATFEVQTIEYDENNAISKVVIVDSNGEVVFPRAGHRKASAPEEAPKQAAKPKQSAPASRKQQVKKLLNTNGGIYTKDDAAVFMDKRNKQAFDDLTEKEFAELLALCKDGAL